MRASCSTEDGKVAQGAGFLPEPSLGEERGSCGILEPKRKTLGTVVGVGDGNAQQEGTKCHRQGMTITFRGQLDRAMGCLDIWSNIFLGVFVRIVLDKIKM